MSINQSGRGARECMTFEQRPSTPPEIGKYRKSNNLEPGKRFQHPGLKDDYKTMGLDDRIYGATDKHSVNRTTAAQLINLPKASELERMNGVKAEKIYKSSNREPLGHGPDRGVVLPMKFTVGTYVSLSISSSLSPPTSSHCIWFPVVFILRTVIPITSSLLFF